MKKLTVSDMVSISLMVAVMAVCAWISIPSAVPFSLQTFGVFFALEMLGGRKGLAAILIYILTGGIGLPVFSGFAGGPSALFGATGGYIWGFAAIGIVYCILEKKSTGNKKMKITAMLAGLILCYGTGTVWFVKVYTMTGGAVGYGSAVAMCVLPFIVPDIIKMVLAVTVSSRIKKALSE